MSSLSIIVPLRGVAAFEDTLVSVLQNRPEDCEVVVVTPGPYDDPYRLAEEVTLAAASPGCSLVEQVNVGCRAARGPVLHVLLPGQIVQEGWTDAAREHFRSPGVGSVALLVLDGARGRVVSAGVRWAPGGGRAVNLAHRRPLPRRLLHVRCDGPDLRAGFWRKAAWREAGGFDPALGPRFADLDLALELAAQGYRSVFEHASRVVSEADGERGAPWSDGRCAERLYWKQAARAHRRPSVVLRAAGLIAGCAADLPRPRRLLERLGRLAALWEGSVRSLADQAAMREALPAPGGLRRCEAGSPFAERERRLFVQRKAV